MFWNFKNDDKSTREFEIENTIRFYKSSLLHESIRIQAQKHHIKIVNLTIPTKAFKRRGYKVVENRLLDFNNKPVKTHTFTKLTLVMHGAAF